MPRCGLQRQRLRCLTPTASTFGPDVSCCVGQALADDALEPFCGAGAGIEAVGSAHVVAEFELGKVAVKVLLATVLIHVLQAALEAGERAFNGVRVDVRSVG